MAEQIHLTPAQLEGTLTSDGINKIVRQFAGLGTFYVPKRKNGNSWHDLLSVLGEVDSQALVNAFGGKKVRLSKGRRPAKKMAILQLLDEHQNAGIPPNNRRIAQLVGCDIRYVQQIKASITPSP